jgi:hypothetical protein
MLSREELAAYVEKSCRESGVPLHLSDPTTLANLARLILGDSEPKKKADAMAEKRRPNASRRALGDGATQQLRS